MMETFDFPLSYGTSGDEEDRLHVAELGDGYSQRAAKGLNATAETVNVLFENRRLAECDQIVAFFRRHAGGQAFLWIYPGETEPKKWMCSKRSKPKPSGPATATITATFTRVYDL